MALESGSYLEPDGDLKPASKKRTPKRKASGCSSSIKNTKKKKSGLSTTGAVGLEVNLEFAICQLDLYEDASHVLRVREDDPEQWRFDDLESKIEEISATNPQKQVFLVGYRNEERPPLVHETERCCVPFIAVHCLDKEAPEYFVKLGNAEKHEADIIVPLTNLPFKWVSCGKTASGKEVKVLNSKSGPTLRSSSVKSYSDHQVWFPTQFDCSGNLLSEFYFCDGELVSDSEHNACYVDDDDVWEPSIRELGRGELEDGKEEFIRLMKETPELLRETLTPIIQRNMTELFEELEEHSAELADSIEESLKSAIKQRKEEMATYDSIKCGLVDAVHYKIYPDNDVLKKYLALGGLHYVNKYADKASKVYPPETK